MRFSSRSTQRVINPKATGWVERKQLPFHPRPRPGLLRPKRPSQPSGCARSPRAAETPPGTRKGLELSGSARAAGDLRPAPPAEPALRQWEPEVRG